MNKTETTKKELARKIAARIRKDFKGRMEEDDMYGECEACNISGQLDGSLLHYSFVKHENDSDEWIEAEAQIYVKLGKTKRLVSVAWDFDVSFYDEGMNLLEFADFLAGYEIECQEILKAIKK